MSNNKKIKILVYGDSPAVNTGFGRVVNGIFYNLVQMGKYEVDIFGINDRGGWKDPQKYPYRVFPAMVPGSNDFYGRRLFVDVLRGGHPDLTPSWDLVFLLQDPFIMEQKFLDLGAGLMRVISDIQKVYRRDWEPETWWKTVYYIPIDSYLKANWVADSVFHSDYPIAYTNYGKAEIEKASLELPKEIIKDIDVIYHGYDSNAFYPIADEKEKDKFRERFFKGKVTKDTFLIGVVARNQMRKDLPRTMKIFKEFQKRRPDSFLYIHAKENDAWGSLGEYARAFNLREGEDWTIPGRFNESVGFPVDALNMLYNLMDVHLLNSGGEGWGLPVTEAMATKTLSMACNITSIPEIFGSEDNDYNDVNEMADSELRGVPIQAGSTTSEWATYGPTDYERIRPLTNVDDAVRKLVWVYDNPDKAQKIAENGYNWIQNYSWKKIAMEWDKLFQRAYQDLTREREEGERVVKKASNKQVGPALAKSERDESKPVSETGREHKENK